MPVDILDAINEAREWLEIDGVVDVKADEAQSAIVVYTSCDPRILFDRIPQQFMGYSVKFIGKGNLK